MVRDEKDDRSSSPAPNSKAKTDDGEEKSAKTSGINEESSSDKRSEIPCRQRIRKKKTRHVNLGILPCVKTASLRPAAYMEENVSSGMLRPRRSPAKSQKKGDAKGSVALLMESTQLGYVSQGSYPRKSILR